jgi:hypothetical protein
LLEDAAGGGDEDLDETTAYADPDANPEAEVDTQESDPEVDPEESDSESDEPQPETRTVERPTRVRRAPTVLDYETLGGAPKLVELKLPRK